MCFAWNDLGDSVDPVADAMALGFGVTVRNGVGKPGSRPLADPSTIQR